MKRTFILFALLFFFSGNVFAEATSTKKSRAVLTLTGEVPPGLYVQTGVWGNAREDNVKAVLQSVLDVYSDAYGGDYVLRRQKVTTVTKTAGIPMALSNLSEIHLNTTNMFWCQYIYQFAHELYHYTCGILIAQTRHQWFEEMLAEMHSLFVLDMLAEKWKTNAPYPNWVDFAPEIRRYYENVTKNSDIGLDERKLAALFKENRKILESKATIPYDKTAGKPDENAEGIRFAYTFAPVLYKEVFRNNPDAWEALKVLHAMGKCGELTFEEYLSRWYKQCGTAGKKSVVKKTASVMGVELEMLR
ncbi:MAG: hypothetical protein FWE67_08630 [Planctomycetaceae bacterium]|nr:hypothetical protein [Planctomycetaceae bacterium]